MRRLLVPLLVLLIGATTLWQRESGTLFSPQSGTRSDTRSDAQRRTQRPLPGTRGDALPAEARATLALIERGGPFPYRKDGSEFRNREGHLPAAARGYYREYTVPTPGTDDRGPRRIVTGGSPPTVLYYTDDHYRIFRPVKPGERAAR